MEHAEDLIIIIIIIIIISWNVLVEGQLKIWNTS